MTAANKKRHGVVVVGSITADISVVCERRPTIGETVLGNSASLALGGKGANQAVAAALAGTPTFLVGCLGDDQFGMFVRDGLVSHQVNLDAVVVVAGPTGLAHIRVDTDGDNDIVIVPLANAQLDPAHVTKSIRSLASSCSVLLTQLEIPLIACRSAIETARNEAMTVVLDPAPALPVPEDMWALVDVVTPNETEAQRYSGIHINNFDDAAKAARWFCARGARNAIVTLGGSGAVLVTPTQTLFFEPIAVSAVDTTAAGDAFSGFLGAELASGTRLEDAIRPAMAAGALAVTRAGASTSLPTRKEVDELLAKSPTIPTS